MKVKTNVKSGVTEGCGCGATTMSSSSNGHDRPPMLGEGPKI